MSMEAPACQPQETGELDDAESSLPSVTVLIPLLDGRYGIADCLAAVAGLDYPRDRFDVIVVDGGSTDGGAELAASELRKHGLNGRVEHNPGRSTSSNLNAGLAYAQGEIICRVDVKTRLPSHYLTKAVALLGDEDRSMVGGGMSAQATSSSAIARAIARAHNNPVMMGGASYRYRGAPGPAETVYLGTCWASELHRVAGWGDDLAQNQDYDLAQRLGGENAVWFDDALTAGWIAPHKLRMLVGRYSGFGRNKVVYWHLRGATPTRRQMTRMGLPVLGGIALVVLSTHASPVRVLLGAAGSSALGLLAIDTWFGPRGRVGLEVRAISALIVAPTIGLSWLAGIALETLRIRSKADRQSALERGDS